MPCLAAADNRINRNDIGDSKDKDLNPEESKSRKSSRTTKEVCYIENKGSKGARKSDKLDIKIIEDASTEKKGIEALRGLLDSNQSLILRFVDVFFVISIVFYFLVLYRMLNVFLINRASKVNCHR